MDERILAPLFFATLVLTTAFAATRPPTYRVVVNITLALLAAWIVYQGIDSTVFRHAEGNMYAGKMWQRSPTLTFIKDLPSTTSPAASPSPSPP
jgi:hypothetical protein